MLEDAQTHAEGLTEDEEVALDLTKEHFMHAAERLAVPLDEQRGLDLATEEVHREQDCAAAASRHAVIMSFVSGLLTLRITRLAAEAVRCVTVCSRSGLEDTKRFQDEDGAHTFDNYCWLSSFDY